MKQLYKYLIITTIVAVFSSCASGLKSYRKGDYFKACIESIDRLRNNPGSEKSQYILKNSYPLAQKTALREIDNANLTNEQDRYDILVYQYSKLNSLSDAIYSCPKALEIIPNPAEYRAELSDAKLRAAEIAYNKGVKALNVGTLDQAKYAYQYFINANDYVNGYKDVLFKIDESRYHATLRILIQKPLVNNKYQYSADFFFANLLAELTNSTKNRLIRFYTQEEAIQSNMRDPHQIITLDFQSFSVGNTKEYMNTSDLSRDSVIVGTVKVEGKTYNSYGTVKAKLTTYFRDIISGGVLNVNIIEASSNRVLQQRNFPGEYTWRTSWSTFKGDDRALTKKQQEMCDLKPQYPPVEQDLFVEFTKPIYSQTLPYLKSVYKNY